MKNQICTILGGGGFIGRYLVRNLTKKNYRCIISTRKTFEKGYLKTQATPGAIELVDWNSSNFSELKEAIKNSDIVINLIGILYETRKQKFYNIHANIPEAVAKICSESDVKKFIHVSAIGANENSKSLYQKSKYQGEVKALNNFKNNDLNFDIDLGITDAASLNFESTFSGLDLNQITNFTDDALLAYLSTNIRVKKIGLSLLDNSLRDNLFKLAAQTSNTSEGAFKSDLIKIIPFFFRVFIFS